MPGKSVFVREAIVELVEEVEASCVSGGTASGAQHSRPQLFAEPLVVECWAGAVPLLSGWNPNWDSQADRF
jgi:hypothetical protein